MSDAREPALFQQPPQRGQWRLAFLVVSIAAALLLASVLWLGNPFRPPAAPPPSRPLPPLDAEAQNYVPSIRFDNFELSRWQNFLGQSVIYLDARVTNGGGRTIRVLELTMEFQDAYNRVVLRETLRPIGGGRPSLADPRSAPLHPGESRGFRAAFEHLPVDWNNAVPQIRVTGLLLE